MLDSVLAAVRVTLFIPQPKIAAECDCPPPLPRGLLFQDYLRAAGARRETPVTCKPPFGGATFDCFTADINFSRKVSSHNLPNTSHKLSGVSCHPSSELPQDVWAWEGSLGGGVASAPSTVPCVPRCAAPPRHPTPREPKKSSSTEVPRSLGEPGRRSINYKALDGCQGPRKLHLACHSPSGRMKP